MTTKIILAGATGNLGERIAKALFLKKIPTRALVRPGTSGEKLAALKSLEVEICEVDYNHSSELSKACEGGTCVVSALSGLRPVIVDAQTQLLRAAIVAKVPRFIPSDFCIDFTKLPVGSNRNLDLRREFQQRLDQSDIAATSILNGAFADMLTGQAPFVLFKFKRILCWGNPEQKMDFTTMDDTAQFTAAAAIDDKAPRFLRIAGSQVSARDLVEIMTELRGEPYKLFCPGGLRTLSAMIQLAKFFDRNPEDLYPPWQGMQYMHNMYSGLAHFQTLDNHRYNQPKWSTAKDVLSKVRK